MSTPSHPQKKSHSQNTDKKKKKMSTRRANLATMCYGDEECFVCQPCDHFLGWKVVQPPKYQTTRVTRHLIIFRCGESSKSTGIISSDSETRDIRAHMNDLPGLRNVSRK